MFFDATPNFLYPDFQTAGKFKISKNLFRRVRARDSFNAIYASATPYTIQNGETADTIAETQLGSHEWYWTILILNNITNIHYQWPLDNDELDRLVDKKYGSFVDSVKYWETNEVKNNAGEIVLPGGNIVEYYNNTPEQNQANYLPQVYVSKFGSDPGAVKEYDKVPWTFKYIDKINTETISVNANSIVTGVVYKITSIGTTDFTIIGASSNKVGLEFTATGAGTGNGTVSRTYDIPQYKTVTAAQNLTKITNREYEYQINELKKEIFLPKITVLTILQEELKELLKYETNYKINKSGERISESI